MCLRHKFSLTSLFEKSTILHHLISQDVCIGFCPKESCMLRIDDIIRFLSLSHGYCPEGVYTTLFSIDPTQSPNHVNIVSGSNIF